MFRRLLARSPEALLVVFATASAFSTYFCMYAFRRPFTAGTWGGDDATFLETGVALKTAYVLSQVLGYMISKYLGIKVCAEADWERRRWLLPTLVVAAHLALLAFAVLPPAWRVVALFANGLPLGMVWGLVVGYLEGRRSSELLLAGLSGSFIVASGIVKEIGLAVMAGAESLRIFALDLPWIGLVRIDVPSPIARFGPVAEHWMPFVTGCLFLPPLLASAWLLAQVPRPTALDEALRVHRQPMHKHERRAFVRRFLPGLIPLMIAYVLLTALRDFRDLYQVELFADLGLAGEVGIFSRSEVWVASGVIGALALLVLIRDNRRALGAMFVLMVTGLAAVGVATLLLDRGVISPLGWMILVGLGAYMAYVPFGSMLFERLIAATGTVGTAVFAIYVADALGYTGSVALQLIRDLGHGGTSRLEFFRGFTLVASAVGTMLVAGAGVYFLAQTRMRS